MLMATIDTGSAVIAERVATIQSTVQTGGKKVSR